MCDNPITLLFLIRNLPLDIKDIKIIIFSQCFKYVRFEPYYNEIYFHNDFVGGEDCVTYEGI